MIYAISAMGAISAFFAFLRPSIWSMFAASVVNAAAVWAMLSAYGTP